MSEFGESTVEAALAPAASAVAVPRRAVIDIGTNSIKLLVADVDSAGVRPVFETAEQTRLGRAFFQTHELQPAAIEASVHAVDRFAREAASLGASAIRLIATSAVRDAVNAQELTSRITRATGLNVEVISGEQEADWAFAGVSSDPHFAGHPLLVLDVGGGSTEFVAGRDGRHTYRHSHRLGTVRLLEQSQVSDPPAEEQLRQCRAVVARFMRDRVRPDLEAELARFRREELRFIGTGGTPVILARIHLGLDAYDRARLESTTLARLDVEAIVRRLWSLPLAGRRGIVGLPPERADVMLAGAVIYAVVMEVFGLDRLAISTRGLRFAAVAALA